MPHQRIEMNPDIMGGKPVVRGTRIPVELVLRKLSAGISPEAILADHPRLALEDIHAAQALLPTSCNEDIVCDLSATKCETSKEPGFAGRGPRLHTRSSNCSWEE